MRFQESQSAQLAVIYLCLVPNSFFFSGIYTESLFFLCCVLCVYAAVQKSWMCAAFTGMLASATRLVGLALWVFLLLEWIKIYHHIPKKRDHWVSLALIQIVPCGLLLFMLYLWATFGSPFVFLETQIHWEHQISNPLNVLISTGIGILRGEHYWWFALGDLLIAIICLGTLRTVLRVLGRSYFTLAALMLLIPLSTSTLSFNRYALVVLPLWLTLAHHPLGQRSYRLYLVIAISVLAGVFTLFVMGVFIG